MPDHDPEELPPNLARLIERGKREADEARREIGGDPAEYFAEVVRETYDYETLRETFREMIGEELEGLDGDAESISLVELQEEPMAVPRKSDEIPPNLARLLERGEKAAEEARRIIGGDPKEAFYELIRKNYDYESVRKVLEEMTEGGPGWLDNDTIDEFRDR